MTSKLMDTVTNREKMTQDQVNKKPKQQGTQDYE